MMPTEIDRSETRAASATAGYYWLPTRPYTLIDAVNRGAAATGSVRYAQQAANSDYNGHTVTVAYNSFRDYCTCEHYWGGRVVHARGSMETALRAGRSEYDLGHRGTCVITCVNGDQKLGGPVEHARRWWRDQTAVGWTVGAPYIPRSEAC